MKGKKHTPQQIVEKLRQADVELGQGRVVKEVCRILEIMASRRIITGVSYMAALVRSWWHSPRRSKKRTSASARSPA